MEKKILIADDMAMDREVLTALLDGEFDVTAVEDGLEAVRKLDANPSGYACLLLDIFMPKMDGFEVLAYMREKGYTTPIIALTSLTDSKGHVQCYEAGVRELLEKPYDRKILLCKVRRMIAGEKAEKTAGESGERLGRFRTLASSDVLADSSDALRFLGIFREDFTKTLAQLRQAIATHDEVGLHAASHAMSGLAANLEVLLGER